MRQRARFFRLSLGSRRLGAFVLSVAVTLTSVPPVSAAEPVLGTIQVSGPAWVATPTADWTKVVATRPLVAGDRLKTDTGGHLVADLGKLGVVGLYGNSEISVTRQGADVAVEVQRGKVAFHLEPNVRLKITSGGAAIVAGSTAADGYVEFDAAGAPIVVVEGDSLNVTLAGGTAKTLGRGERLALTGAADTVPTKVVTAEDERKAGAAAAPPEEVRKKYAGLSGRGWTALAIVAVAVGVGVGVGVGGGGGGGGGDSSPSGDSID